MRSIAVFIRAEPGSLRPISAAKCPDPAFCGKYRLPFLSSVRDSSAVAPDAEITGLDMMIARCESFYSLVEQRVVEAFVPGLETEIRKLETADLMILQFPLW